MPRVNLFLLGPPRLEQDGQHLEIDARKTLALLAYLAVSGQRHRRETLDTLLWPELEPRRARAVLRRNLSTLNKTLSGQWLTVDKDLVGLDHSADAWLDVAEFRQLAHSGQEHDHPETEVCADCLNSLAQAVALYRGDFMAGFTVRDSSNFDDWQLFESEGLKRELAGVLDKLAQGHGDRNELEPAISYAQRWLSLDPLHEPAHRRLMQLYAANGDRSAALRQYQTCVQVLEEELGLPPEDETTTLYERIRRESQRHSKLIAASFVITDGATPEGLAKNLLGQGGMGSVYRGLNVQTGETVAIKVLKPEIVATSPDLVERFVREGEALGRLNHPNIVKMLAAAEQEGQHYLVMEYVSGGSLHDLIANEGALPVGRVLDIALDLADALTRAHRLGIIHRDLKPPNVLLTADGAPRLTDFGLARQLDGPRTTKTGVIMGTIEYLSPEGCEGKRLDERADIWAFGVILFEMLSGERPFKGETLPSILTAILSQPAPDLSRYRSDIPRVLIDLVRRMVVKDPDQRLPSVRLVGAELEAIMADRPMTPVTPIVPAIPAGPPPACPYRGLFAFREEDAPFFFGREEFIRQLIEAAQRQALVAVVGSSGSGKSSVVLAGLLAHLLQKTGWIVVKFRPGSDPFQALAGALLPLLEPGLSEIDQLAEIRKLAQRLARAEISLVDIVERILEKKAGARRLMMAADQFEELYTLCPEPEIRHDFMDLLFELIDLQQYRSSPTFTFVFTLRADFLEQALSHRPLADTLQNSDLKLGPMTREELGRAIENPAQKQGVSFESGLIDRILDDVGEEPGNLPLLEFALTTLWEQQQSRQLTHTGYEAISRVEGALARHADEIYAGLSSPEQTAARRIFIQLVRPGENTEDTRRLARRSELSADDWQLVQRLADARLVVTGRDAGGSETVEVVHEALIRSWDQLRSWMAADRAFRAWQERLRAALRQWEASAQDDGALLRGVPLATAEEWLAHRPDDLSQIDRQFIEAGIELREQQAAEQERQRQRELEAANKLAEEEKARRQAEEQHAQEAEARAREQAQASSSLRRRALLLAGVGIVAVLLAIAAGVFGIQSSRNATQAEAEKTEAERQARVALSRRLALEVGDQLDQNNVDTALLLAVEAGRTAETVEAFMALRQAINHPQSLLLTLSGHTDGINQVLWNADESQILSTSWDGTARVWAAKTGQELLTLNHEDNANSVVGWNNDETRILTISADDTVRVWDAVTGVEHLTLNLAYNPTSAVWDEAEQRILTSDFSGIIQVWDADTGTELLTLSGHANLAAAQWNPSGSRILSFSWDGTAKVWDADTGQELLTLSGHTAPLWYGAFYAGLVNKDESRMLTSSADRTARVWDTETGEELLVLAGHEDVVWQAEWNADESRILTASEDGTARIWDAETGAELVTLAGHTAAVKWALWHPTDNLVLTASEDGTTRVWGAETGTQVGPPFGHPAAVVWARWNADGSRFVTGTAAGTVRVWRWGQPEIKPELPTLNPASFGLLRARWNKDESRILTSGLGGRFTVWDAASGERLLSGEHGDTLWQSIWNKDESRILTASADGTARVSDAETGETLLTIAGHADGLDGAEWNADESRILTASADGTAKIWDAVSGEALLTFFGHTDSVYDASWNAAEDRILTAGFDGTAKVWNATTGEALLTLNGHSSGLYQAHWNADESRILTLSQDGPAQVWDANTGQEVLSLSHPAPDHQGSPVAVWSRDESQILTAGYDGTAKVWDAETGQILLTLSGHTDGLLQAIWNSDESRILTAGKDGTARVWDAVSGAELIVLSDHTGTVNQARWNADESRILTASGDGTARQYYTRLEDVIAVACERVSRNLTRAEWRQFIDDQPYRATCPELPVREE